MPGESDIAERGTPIGERGYQRLSESVSNESDRLGVTRILAQNPIGSSVNKYRHTLR